MRVPSPVAARDHLPFISKLTLVVCPALTSTSFSCLPSVSCHTSIFCLPAGTFSSFATPLGSVPPPPPRPTPTQPRLQLCPSQVTLTNSRFSSFSVLPFLDCGSALLMPGL